MGLLPAKPVGRSLPRDGEERPPAGRRENQCNAIQRGDTMRNYRVGTIVLSVLLLFVGCFAVPAVKAEEQKEDKPTATIGADILSQYIFRGYALSRDSAVIQPSVTVGYKGFSLNIWGNFDTDDAMARQGSNWNETDVTFSYTHELFKNFNATVGTVYYGIEGPDSFEVFGGVSYAFPWVTVGLTAYREVAHFPGWYVQLDVSHTFTLPWYGMTFDLGGSFGYATLEHKDNVLSITNGAFNTGSYSALHAGQILGALHIPVCKYFTVSPKVGVAFPLSDLASHRIAAGSWDTQDTHVFGGVNLSANF